MSTISALKLVARRSAARGHADHGWLKSYHTFSFASYQEQGFDQYGPLRVINEDRVAPAEGFGTHSHREFEIFSYVIAGELEHKDSLGGLEVLKRGDLQMTSTGTGISHSEFNRNPTVPVYFLQIWGLPHTRGLKPCYYKRHFTDEDKLNKLCTVVKSVGTEGVIDDREAKGPAPIHSHLTMHASILEPKQSIPHSLAPKTTKGYLHLIMKSGYRSPNVSASDKFEDGGAKLRVNGVNLEEGDGLFVEVKGNGTRDVVFENVGERAAEFLFFEME